MSMSSSVFRVLCRSRPAPVTRRNPFGKKDGVLTQQESLTRCLARFQGTSSKLHESPSADPKPISRFPIPDRKTLPEDIQSVMEEVEKQSGFLPNIFKLMSYHPESFHSFFGYYNVLMADRGHVTKEDKELITLVISMENRCLYCTISHRPLLKMLTSNPTLPDQVTVNWQSADLTDRQRAIVEFALAVTKNDPVTPDHFSRLEAQGLDRQDAFDIGHFAAFFALANRLAIFSALRPNEEFYMMD